MSTPNLIKRVLRQAWLRNTGTRLLGWYLKLVDATSRFEIIGKPEYDAFEEKQVSFCAALWHNRLCMMPLLKPQLNRPLTIVISGHRDGLMVGDVFRHFGIGAVPARSGTQDMEAARGIAKAARARHLIGITPDGPRGPRMRMKPFAVDVARLCRSRVTLVTGSCKRRIVFNSWDRFILPLPFNRGVFMWEEGPPVPEKFDEASMEKYRQELEDSLTRLTDRADRHLGKEPIAPDERPWSAGPAPKQKRQREKA
ncbi:MAG: lysophospholipid acyltransferase family protein [Hyphomicrobiales bacterium]